MLRREERSSPNVAPWFLDCQRDTPYHLRISSRLWISHRYTRSLENQSRDHWNIRMLTAMHNSNILLLSEFRLRKVRSVRAVLQVLFRHTNFTMRVPPE